MWLAVKCDVGDLSILHGLIMTQQRRDAVTLERSAPHARRR